MKAVNMANYPIHGKILDRISLALGLTYTKEILENRQTHFRENIALAYEGDLYNFQGFPKCSLINVNDVATSVDMFDNIDEVKELNYVQPDFMLFSQNKFFEFGEKDFRIVGCPDLIIEIWSKGNKKKDRTLFSQLYSTSKITEFWQIDLINNAVIRTIGQRELTTFSIAEKLTTESGLYVDLTTLKHLIK
ncbi:MAG: Uma2 family endonuclease [Firmicutes bacterium]|nr:Uma2 family endonuclease [Bacillota bacterium]